MRMQKCIGYGDVQYAKAISGNHAKHKGAALIHGQDGKNLAQPKKKVVKRRERLA